MITEPPFKSGDAVRGITERKPDEPLCTRRNSYLGCVRCCKSSTVGEFTSDRGLCSICRLTFST